MKPRIKKILKIIAIILLPVVLQAFAANRNKTRNVKEVKIEHLSKDVFITDQSIRKMIIKDPQAGILMSSLKLNELEKTLNEHVMIEQSQVFCTIDGVLEAKIQHRQPIARIYHDDHFFYMDSKGKKMPLSPTFSARVPLILANIEEKNWDSTFKLVNFIRNDDFLDKNITQIKVNSNGEYDLKMRIPDFVVRFGKFEDIELKKANLKAFYKQLEKTNKLNEYRIINLKYINQVVCIK